MSTTLCLDLGNTRLKWAVFSDGEIRHTGVLQEDGVEDLRKCLEIYKPDKSILSSVVDHSPALEEYTERPILGFINWIIIPVFRLQHRWENQKRSEQTGLHWLWQLRIIFRIKIIW